MRYISGALFMVIALLAAPPSAFAQNYPNKPIRFVVPAPAGGGTGLVASTIGKKMTESWGIQVLIDNRPGAQGNIGHALVAKAPPDGYTIVAGYVNALCLNPFMYSDVGFDSIKDFAPVSLATQQPYFLIVHPSLPALSLKQLVALAKTHPNRLNFGTTGSLPQLAGEMMKSMARINMTHIPYKGSADVMPDLLSGRLELTFSSPGVPLPFIRSGKLRLLAVTSSKRIDIVRDTPTVAEAGLPGYEITGWYGVLAPTGTPKEIINKLSAEIVRILKLPDIREQLTGYEPGGSTPEEFSAYLKKEMAKYAHLVKESGIKVE